MSYPKLTPIIAKGATEPRYLEDRFADVVNVKDYGATGDGVTDDTAAFAVASTIGDTILVPPGTYYLPTEPEWGDGKNVVLYAPSQGVSFTGTYGLSKLGNWAHGLQFFQINSTEDSGRHILSLTQNLNDTGEATSNIYSSIYSMSFVGEGCEKKCWGITGAVRTKATARAGDAVGGYFQGWRQSDDSLTPTWGAVAEVRDQSLVGSPGGIVGLEVDCGSSGDATQTFNNRLGIDICGMSADGQSSFTVDNVTKNNRLGYGIRITAWKDTNDSSKYQTIWHCGIFLDGFFDNGIAVSGNSRFYDSIIDLSNAGFLGGDEVAIKIRQGHKFVFSHVEDAPYIRAVGDGSKGLVFYCNGEQSAVLSSNTIGVKSISLWKYVSDGQGGTVRSGSVAIHGHIETGTASASFSASNKPGGNATTPATWIKTVIDGSTFWIPAFAN